MFHWCLSWRHDQSKCKRRFDPEKLNGEVEEANDHFNELQLHFTQQFYLMFPHLQPCLTDLNAPRHEIWYTDVPLESVYCICVLCVLN